MPFLAERYPIFPERNVDLGDPGGRASSASLPDCLFCGHTNPAKAKFCNECGSPLHLKPCTRCEAINDAAAATCYNCGHTDPTAVLTAETAPVSTSAGSTPASATSNDASFEPVHQWLPGYVAMNDVDHPRRPVDPIAQERMAETEAVAPDVRASVGLDGSLPFEAPGTTQAGASPTIEAATGWRPVLRVAAAALPPVLLLAAVAVAACYAYLHPLQLREWLNTTQALVDQSTGRTSMPATSGTTSVAAPPAPPVGVAPASIATVEAAAPAPSNETATDAPTSPVLPDGAGAPAADGTIVQASPNPSQAGAMPQARAATSAQATRAPPAGRATKKTSTGTKATAKKSSKAPAKKPGSTSAAPAASTTTKTPEAPTTATGQ